MHGLTPSFPTRRSSGRGGGGAGGGAGGTAATVGAVGAMRSGSVAGRGVRGGATVGGGGTTAEAAAGRVRSVGRGRGGRAVGRSEEHTSELQSLMRISYAVLWLKNKNYNKLH